MRTDRNRPLLTGCRRDRGTVLIIVMWVALGLVSLALFFGDSMVLEYRTADNGVASLEAAHAIEGARRYVAFVLDNLAERGAMPDVEEYVCERTAVGQAAFWLIGRTGDEEQTSNVPVFRLVDEGAKLNLNTATPEMLELLPGMTAELAAAILDWRDPDPELTPGGAESQDYLLENTPYYCKDSRFETVEELRLVMGCDRKILYGEDFNHNGVLDPNEDDGDESFPEDDRDGKLDAGLFEYVTVSTREPNTQADGSPRINIRTSPGELMQRLRAVLGDQRTQDLQRSLGPSLQNTRSVLEFYALCAGSAGMTAAEFAQIEDALTVSDGDFVEGRVNVNTAPAEVLACLPGVGEANAQQLVAYRRDKDAASLKSVAWVVEVLGPEVAPAAGPFITTRTYQFRADVAAVGHNGRGFRRDLMIFDTTGGEAVVIYRRDLTSLGWPLGEEVRRELASAKE